MAAIAPVRVGIVEDHQLFADLLRTSIESEPDLRVVLTTTSATAARDLFVPSSVDVMILDIQLGDGDGFQLGIELKRVDPAMGVLILSSYDRMDLLLDLPESHRPGWSYLSKTGASDVSTLVNTIRTTATGGAVIDPKLVHAAKVRRNSSIAALTPRQLYVLRLLAEGRSNSGIAQVLGIRSRSVENHLNVIYATLGLSRESQDQNPRVAATLEFLRGSASV